jgi:hypothetical protein
MMKSGLRKRWQAMIKYRRAKRKGLSATCAWCGMKMSSGSPAYSIGGTLRQGAEVMTGDGVFILIQAAETEKPIPCLVTINGSKAEADGIDIVFMTHSLACAECLRTFLGQCINIFDKLILVDF